MKRAAFRQKTSKGAPKACSMGDPFVQPNFRPDPAVMQQLNGIQQTGGAQIQLGETADISSEFE